MSEQINIRSAGATFRWRLLATVSTAALLAAAYGPGKAHANDADRPTIWVELGGQLERTDGGQEPFAPPFALITPTPDPYKPISPLEAQKPPLYSYGADAKIIFQPQDSDWLFTAAVRYGRSNSNKHVHQQTILGSFPIIPNQYTFVPTPEKLADTKARNYENHLVLDFKAGRDVGLGFSSAGDSSISLGVRFAQFESHSYATLYARPDMHVMSYYHLGSFLIPIKYFNDYNAKAYTQRGFHGVGPSISWDASMPFAGNSDTGSISFDWGVNAAILFGRQTARGQHQNTDFAYIQKFFNPLPQSERPPTNGYGYTTRYKHTVPHNRSRFVTVPNIGGLAGISFRRGAAKVSFGYQADFFFGAIDDGIDVRHTANRGFYGPFVKIGIGLGG